MGHGVPSAFAEPSGLNQAVQWPLSPAPADTGRRLRLGVMASGSGSNFEALVLACRSGNLMADVVLLVVNNPDCGAIARAERLGVPVQLHDHRRHNSREDLDRALIGSFRQDTADLVVMAGWMRIVTQELINAYPERLINIHPSLLPSFRGARAIEQALAAGVRLSGCTAHLVSLEVDTGPILVQAAVPVDAADTAESLAARIHAQEHRILPLAVQLAAERLGLAQG
ncbi:MAG: phosphoribosylglycinamide formyltransferase [Vulcanococcus sp.]